MCQKGLCLHTCWTEKESPGLKCSAIIMVKQKRKEKAGKWDVPLPFLDKRCEKLGTITIMLIALAFAHFSSELLWNEQMIIPVKKTLVISTQN